MSKLQLRRVRAQLGLSQKGLADLAGISEQTVIEAERGRRQIRLISAYAMLNALNEVRHQRGLSELDIDALDWNIES